MKAQNLGLTACFLGEGAAQAALLCYAPPMTTQRTFFLIAGPAAGTTVSVDDGAQTVDVSSNVVQLVRSDPQVDRGIVRYTRRSVLTSEGVAIDFFAFIECSDAEALRQLFGGRQKD